MARTRAPRSRGPALVRAALIGALVALGPGVSALGVARSMRLRTRPYLLLRAPATDAPAAAPSEAGGRRAAGAPVPLPLELPPAALPHVVRQSRSRSCGAAALATVLAWKGRPVGESAVLARARLRADGLTLAELARLAGAFEVPAAWYAVRADDLPRLPTPFIAHLRADGGHYVAVWRVARGFALIADPALGLTAERLTRFRRDWSGRVMLFRDPALGAAP